MKKFYQYKTLAVSASLMVLGCMVPSSIKAATEYIYDATGARIATYENSGGIVKNTYYIDPELQVEVNEAGLMTWKVTHEAAGKAAMIETVTDQGASHTYDYLHPDNLGSTTLVTDQNGYFKEKTIYYPYGQTRNYKSTTTAAVTMRGYTGQVSDQKSTGLYYYNARYYNPLLGRFTQPDTAGDDLNRYAYVGNNPINKIDPSGHREVVLPGDTLPGFPETCGFGCQMGNGMATGLSNWTQFNTAFGGNDTPLFGKNNVDFNAWVGAGDVAAAYLYFRLLTGGAGAITEIKYLLGTVLPSAGLYAITGDPNAVLSPFTAVEEVGFTMGTKVLTDGAGRLISRYGDELYDFFLTYGRSQLKGTYGSATEFIQNAFKIASQGMKYDDAARRGLYRAGEANMGWFCAAKVGVCKEMSQYFADLLGGFKGVTTRVVTLKRSGSNVGHAVTVVGVQTANGWEGFVVDMAKGKIFTDINHAFKVMADEGLKTTLSFTNKTVEEWLGIK